MCRGWILVTVVAVLVHGSVFAQNPAAQAQPRGDTRLWYDLYEEGVRQVAARNWQPAIDNLQAALKVRSQQGRRVVFYGSRIAPYIPDYYLGVAYLNLQRFAEADAAFERARQASLVTQADSQFRDFQTQASRAKFEATLARAQQFVKEGDVERAAREVSAAEKLGGDATRVTVVQGQIDQLAKATTPKPPVEELTAVPNLLGSNPQTARDRLVNAGLTLGAVQQREGDATVNSVLGQSVAPGTRLPRGASVDIVVAAPKLNVGPTPAPPAPNPIQPANPAPGGGRSGRGTGPRTPLPPASKVDERTAIAAFYSGRYAEAARDLAALIDASETPGSRASSGLQLARPSPRARLYLACSLAALVITGDRDTSEVSNARQQLARAGSLGQFSSDLRFISPRILTMLGVRQ